MKIFSPQRGRQLAAGLIRRDRSGKFSSVSSLYSCTLTASHSLSEEDKASKYDPIKVLSKIYNLSEDKAGLQVRQRGPEEINDSKSSVGKQISRQDPDWVLQFTVWYIANLSLSSDLRQW